MYSTALISQIIRGEKHVDNKLNVSHIFFSADHKLLFQWYQNNKLNWVLSVCTNLRIIVIPLTSQNKFN